MFRGIVNEFEDEFNEVDLPELDSQAFGLKETLDAIQPNRDTQLDVDYLGITGDIELIFNFKTNWMDRDSDLGDYLDDVESEIENGMNLVISDREILGIREL
jgi:hypothetical protein